MFVISAKKSPRTGGNIVGQDDEGLFVQFSRSVPGVTATSFSNLVGRSRISIGEDATPLTDTVPIASRFCACAASMESAANAPKERTESTLNAATVVLIFMIFTST